MDNKISCVVFLLVLTRFFIGIIGNPPDWNKTGSFLDVPTNPPEPCGEDTPCGWGLYDRFSREVDSYMQNRNCYCEEGTACYRQEDNRMKLAFIYRCRVSDPRDTGEYNPW
ncbi:uncharacterized protein [Onthophagus taurus]|uniref:uncharacterized protein n=1 Tax=Onthophagus taurus TaxID=166361 RepID=UPI000C1FF1B5|nr:uncharacterized protein LOC111415772 [Onthophagus taurus]